MKAEWITKAAALGLILAVLSGCGRKLPPEPVAQPIEVPVEQTATEQSTETEPVLQDAGETEAVSDGKRNPGGSVMFYVDNHGFRAGGPVADILRIGVKTDEDLSAYLAPGQISGNISARVELDHVSEEDEPLFFFHAVNTADEPLMISRCTIYSVIVNVQPGIEFGRDHADERFCCGASTIADLQKVYGNPDFYRTISEHYEEMAYHEPFDSLYFSFEDGVVRQILAFYSEQERKTALHSEHAGTEFARDSLLLMGKYLDISPYLAGGDLPAAELKLEETIILGDIQISLGSSFSDMPEYFTAPYEKAPLKLAKNYYILTGKENPEEFYLFNNTGKGITSFRKCTVMGVVTHNADYTNWGCEYSEYLPFAYQGLNNESGIDDVIRIFGNPQKMNATATAHACFVWMHYRSINGNELRIRVDPMTNQIAELRVLKYYPNAVTFQ